jgi:hypothetical protein
MYVILQYELYGTRLEELKGNPKGLLTSTKDPCALLNLVSTMQRLGIAYHFEKEIEEALALLYPNLTANLHTTALQFRVLRQHGFSISSGTDVIVSPNLYVFHFCFYEASLSDFGKTCRCV